MKKVSKTLAIVLCLVMILSLTALANWTEVGKDSSHNHVVTSSPTSSTPTITQLAMMNAGGGWDGVDTEPLLRTVGSTTYAYVLYDGHGASGRLVKINCSDDDPYVVWDKQISGGSGFQLSNPLLVPGSTEASDVIYLAASNAAKNAGVAVSNDISIASGSSATVTCSGLTLATASNRVAIGVLLGEYSTQQTSFSAHGSASLALTGGSTVNLTLNPDSSTSSTNYHVVEEVVHDAANNTVTYQYWWYINQNISGTTGSGKTLTATISLTDHAGTIKSAQMFGQTAAVQKVTNLTATSADDVTVTTIKSGITGQINTPITTDGTYLYFGTYTGYNATGTYYQINTSGAEIGTCSPANHCFYWAGAVSDGTNVYFGSDGGMLYWRPIANFSTSSGGQLDLTSIVSDAGNVRSTIMLEDGIMYFTSQGGYLWIASFENNSLDAICIKLGGTSTSTPTKVGNRIYVGCYGGATISGVQCVDISAEEPTATYVVKGTTSAPMPVQSSVVVKGTGTGVDYLYFVTNAAAGTGYCYSWAGSGMGTLVWNGVSTGTVQTYALGGMAIENGIAVFGNDYNYVSIVK